MINSIPRGSAASSPDDRAPGLGSWLVSEEYSGLDAAKRVNEVHNLRNGDGFEFLPGREPYLRVETAELGLDAIRVGRIVSSGHVYRLANAHEDWVVITCPRTGMIAVTEEDGEVVARNGDCILIPPGTRSVAAVPFDGDFVADRLLVSWPLVKASLKAISEDYAAHPRFAGFAVESEAAAPMKKVISDLLQKSHDQTSRLHRVDLMEVAEKEIVNLVAHVLAAAGAFQDAHDHRPFVALELVRNAEAIIRRHASDDISIRWICRILGVGERSLQVAFRKLRGYSPRSCLIGARLQLARRRLMSSTAESVVTTAATDAGFTHLGRFASYYRKRYGESPSQSLSRIARSG